MNRSINIHDAELAALKMRFKSAQANDILILFGLPNGLIVITFNPSFLADKGKIEPIEHRIGSSQTQGSPLCNVDNGHVPIPFDAALIDYNTELMDNLESFKKGITESFIAVVKPSGKLTFPLVGFTVLFNQ